MTMTHGPNVVDVYDVARIPKRFRMVAIESDIVPSAALQVEEYLDALDYWFERGVGFLLGGPAGVGKSRLACAFLRQAVDRGYTGEYWTFEELARVQKTIYQEESAWSTTGDEDAYASWRRLTKAMRSMRNEVQFVVIDDIGKEHRTGSAFAEDEFHFLMRYRYDRSLPTIITTNYTAEQIAKTYGDAMQSFLTEACPRISCRAEDYRPKVASRLQTASTERRRK